MADINDIIAQGPRPPQVDDPQQAYAKTLTLGNMIQQQQMGQLQLAQAKQDFSDQQTMRQAYMDSGGDLDKFHTLLMQRGVSPKAIIGVQAQMLDMRQKYATLGKDQLANDQARHDQLRGELQSFMSLPTDQKTAGWQGWINSHVANGRLTGQEGQALLQQYPQYPGDDVAKLYSNGLATGSQLMKEASEGQTAAARASQAKTAADKLQAELPGIQTNAKLLDNKLKLIQNADPEQYGALVDSVAPLAQNAELNKRMHAQVEFALKRGDIEGANAAIKAGASEVGSLEKAIDPRVQQNKINVVVAATQGRNDANTQALNDDDWKRMGERYARYGELDSLGNGSEYAKTRIIHEGNEWARAHGFSPADLEVMHAAAKGDKTSLNKFVAQRDQIASFEETATKNLDVFLDAAKNIPDTGVPWMNVPLRMLDEKLVGSENMAAVNAARNVYNNEFAKVTGGGGLSGVLSDSARHDMSDVNPKDATFGQMLKVAAIMKKDMANRHESMDNAVDLIKSHIGQGAANVAPAGGGGLTPTKAYNPKTGRIEPIQQGQH